MGTIRQLKYKIVKNFLDKKEIELFTTYSLLRHKNNFNNFDNFTRKKNNIVQQLNNNCDSFFHADPLGETLLMQKKKLMEQETLLKLHPTYSFFRIYSFNADLKKHLDRESCEISVTIMIGSDGTEWPIYMNDKPVELIPGDACIYMGREVNHYRKNFKGDWHSQLFLHYVDQEGPFKDFKYDKRIITPEI